NCKSWENPMRRWARFNSVDATRGSMVLASATIRRRRTSDSTSPPMRVAAPLIQIVVKAISTIDPSEKAVRGTAAESDKGAVDEQKLSLSATCEIEIVRSAVRVDTVRAAVVFASKQGAFDAATTKGVSGRDVATRGVGNATATVHRGSANESSANIPVGRA